MYLYDPTAGTLHLYAHGDRRWRTQLVSLFCYHLLDSDLPPGQPGEGGEDVVKDFLRVRDPGTPHTLTLHLDTYLIVGGRPAYHVAWTSATTYTRSSGNYVFSGARHYHVDAAGPVRHAGAAPARRPSGRRPNAAVDQQTRPQGRGAAAARSHDLGLPHR